MERDPAAPVPAPSGLGPLSGLLGMGEGASDHVKILAGTGQNIVGLAVFVLASFGMNILIARAFGSSGRASLGVVTLATQFAFVLGTGARFGMDVAAVRRVAIDVGKGEHGRVRAVVFRAVAIAAVAAVVIALGVFAAASGLADRLKGTPDVFRAAALALPFVALCQVYLGGSRGLKIMRHTLYVQWMGQPLLWIAFTLVGWGLSKTVEMTVFAYALSWIVATVAAWFLWERETSTFPRMPAESGELGALIRYGTPRAPAALLAHVVFWTDYVVVSQYVSRDERGVYAAAVQVALALVLFLTAVSYMFSPYVADLHARGERQKLDGLFKSITRWTLAGTIPLLLVFVVVPEAVLKIFGAEFHTGTGALRILLIGQIVNVGVGAVGFVLIMVGRTGWDLTVYAGSFLLDLGVSLTLAPKLGIEGAAIAQSITLVTANLTRVYLVHRFVGIQPFNRYYFRLLIPASMALVPMLLVHVALGGTAWIVDLFCVAAVGLIVYAIALVAFGLTPTEREAAGRIADRFLRRGGTPAGKAPSSPGRPPR